MGTSADFSAPPNWKNVKTNVTLTGGAPASPEQARELLQDYVATNGGTKRMTTGRGQLGSGRTAKNAARALGGFISSVRRDGLNAALISSGLESLVGKSVTEILLGIASICGGTAGDIDSVDARNALSATMHELCANASTPEELEVVLGGQLNGDALGSLMMRYFGNYLFEQFCRTFFGQLVQKHGDSKADSFLQSIRDVINSDLAHRTFGSDLSKVDWFGREGNQIAKAVMSDTLAVFE